ncbi:MAG: heme ABC exporter ATP-binding protein CcmA [Ktedonobacteraceae bacterium]
MNNLFLEITGLKKSFNLKPVLRGIDLTLCRGERMALLGANGAGKTTLLRILAGLTKPSAGSVYIEGLDIVQDARQVRHLVGFVAHQPYLYEELTALENLHFFGKMYSVKNTQERANLLLRKVGLEKRARERAAVLSRGQVQRLSLARALLHSPPFLLLDEPDTGLDQEGRELIEALLAEHRAQGGTILFTTHQIERALQLSDSITMLNKGRIVFQKKTAELELEKVQRTYQEVTYT